MQKISLPRETVQMLTVWASMSTTLLSTIHPFPRGGRF